MSNEDVPDAGALVPTGRTLVERLVKGDWRSAAIVAGPTVLVAFVLGIVASSYLIWSRASLVGGDSDIGGHTNAGFFRTAFTLSGMAFGSPTFTSADGTDSGSAQAGMAPLTITVLTIAAFVYLLRRYGGADNYRDRVETAIRAGLLTAIGMALLTIGMWGTVHGIHQTGSPGRAFFWTLLGLGLVAGAASVRTTELTERQQDIWSRWRLPIHGAVVAVTTAIVVGGIAGILIITAQVDSSNRGDVLKAMPILLAYLVNLGIDVLHLSVGAALHVSTGFFGVSVSLFNRHGLPAEYLLLFLLPPIVIAAGISWIRRHRAEAPPQEIARACYRMALPAALLCFAIAVPSRVGFAVSGEGSFGGGGHAGVALFVGTLIIFGWFLVLGYLVGQWFLPRDVAGSSGTPSGPPRYPAWLRGSVAAGPLAIVAGLIGVVVAAGGIASAKSGVHPADLGPVSNITMHDELDAESETFSEQDGASVTVVPATPPPTPVPVGANADTETVNVLNGYAIAEDNYESVHRTFTTDPTELSNLPDASAMVLIIRGDATSFCIQTTDRQGNPWHIDGPTETISAGTC